MSKIVLEKCGLKNKTVDRKKNRDTKKSKKTSTYMENEEWMYSSDPELDDSFVDIMNKL